MVRSADARAPHQPLLMFPVPQPAFAVGLRVVEALQLLPAVDVQDGRAVQLVQGVAGTQKEFGDPLAAALRWQEEGASWIHLVDLDAAFGRGSNAALLAGIIGAMDVDVELSGGIRDDASLERPEWCEQIIETHGDRVAIGLDVRGEKLAARGWTTEGGLWPETLDRLAAAGCRRFVVTDVNSDGMLTGPNLDLLGDVCARTSAAVIASGGISTLDDLRSLRGLVRDGVEGAIVGTALYLGRFTLAEAIEVAGPQQIGGAA